MKIDREVVISCPPPWAWPGGPGADGGRPQLFVRAADACPGLRHVVPGLLPRPAVHHTGPGRARFRVRWLLLAALTVGTAGVWGMHFVAMLGFTIPGQTIRYSVPVTIFSMLIAAV